MSIAVLNVVRTCAIAACVVWAVTAGAADSLAGLMACRDVTDATARLACFDREAARLRPDAAHTGGSSAATEPSAPPAAAPARPVSLDPQQRFGLPEAEVAAHEVAAGTRPADASKIEAHITELGAAGDGRTVFTLDNGQVWRELIMEADLLAKVGDTVTVSRGVLGSYWLQLANRRGCKVTRLR